MFTIFIATDFSEAAENATQYAVSIAKSLKAEVVLFHACEKHKTSEAIECTYILDEECKKIEKEVKCRHVTGDEYSAEKILVQAQKNNAALLVIGVTEASHLKKDVFGSIVPDLIKESKIPILAIPEKAKFGGVAKLVFALGTIAPDIDLLKRLSKIATGLNAQLQVIHLLTGSEKQVMSFNELDEEMKKAGYINVVFKALKGNNVAHDLENYVQKEGAAILIMVRKNTSLLHEISSGLAGKMTYISRIPLLIFNEDVYTIGPLGIKEEEILG